MSRKVWFSLPAEFSPDTVASDSSSRQSPAFSWHHIDNLQEISNDTDGSDVSSSFCEPRKSSLIEQELSQYPLRPSMDAQGQSETMSTNDSPDISSSQQESTMSDGPYGYDDGNSTSSLHDSPHDEAVSTAIMELSGELMLGQFTRHKATSGGSESSDISDDDIRRQSGVIAKYPESSTGLSDNDWNPYATESDTNQTPRSPRSVASDEQNRVGYVSKATFSIAQPKESTTTISMATGKVTVDGDKVSKENGQNANDRLNILRYVMDDDKKPDENRRCTIRSPEDDVRVQSPDTVRSGYSDGSRSGRQSTESGQSMDTIRRESAESAGSFKSDGRQSSEFGLGESKRESVESARSIQSDGTGAHSGRQSVESAQSGRSSRSDLDQSGGSGKSGRQSADSQGSQKSTGRTTASDRSERLDRIKDAAGDNLKELIQFESAQRFTSASGDSSSKNKNERTSADFGGDNVVRTRLTAKLEPYTPSIRSSKSPDYSSNIGSSGYISIAEREKLLNNSDDVTPPVKAVDDRQTDRFDRDHMQYERSRPGTGSVNHPDVELDSYPHRSPSDVSMKRVSNLFEETKRQVREAVAVPRPDPSGSEERFPLSERISLPMHVDSFKDKSATNNSKGDKSRDSEIARSLTSEEVARVLGRYTDDDVLTSHKDYSKMNGSGPVAALDKVDRESDGDASRVTPARYETPDSVKTEDLSDDEISRRVRALIAQTGNYGSHADGKPVEYVPRTIDYSRLQKDLQEIQDSLQDAPPPMANDSIQVQRRNIRDTVNGETEETRTRDEPRSDSRLENTATTTGGRESGASEYGRRLVWDYGADLEYDRGYGGQFIGTMATTGTDTLSSLQFRSTSGSNTLVRPDSAVSNQTDNENTDFEGTKTLTGSDITRAEKIVEQVMSRRAEGDLKESVEDIIARYRNERRDLFDRLQAPPEPKTIKPVSDLGSVSNKPLPEKERPILKDPDVLLPTSEQNGDQNTVSKKHQGLAERVYKILTSEENDGKDLDNPNEKGMAKQVYKILANDRPQEQVNGILTETMAVEHELLKQMVSKPKGDSSLDDSGLNGTTEESFTIDDNDIRKQLEYSQFSSPGKGDKSELTALREVTSAPYSSVSNAKSLLSTQLKKMSERNFDKSVELRAPYSQTISCYPVYGVDPPRTQVVDEPREAWMPVRRSATARSSSNRDSALSSDRFYLTDRDQISRDTDRGQTRSRTYSDPFDLSPSRRPVGSGRDGHLRSRSEEAGNVSDISQYSFAEPTYSPTERKNGSSPRTLKPEGLSTPQIHRPQEYYDKKKPEVKTTVKPKEDFRSGGSPSPTESDTSESRKGAKFRPYRPAGSREVYYTESGADDTNESGTTVESTHIGSDDAAPPYIPSQFLGSRRDEPVKHPTGIYGHRETKDALSTIDEQSVKDDREKALSASGGSIRDGAGSDKRSVITTDTGYQTATVRSRSPVSQRDDLDTVGHSSGRIERPGFKTREEYQRDFEQREKELKELLSRRQPSEPQTRDSLGTSTRSDPGLQDEPGTNWEYRMSDQNEFQRLEPEPAYPQDRLRYSRSKSDTDLALSPAESQRYSSPMQPGTRFLELSTQPSPIFHQDSMTYPSRGAPRNVPDELPRVPVEREQRLPPPAKELPKVYDRRPVLSAAELPAETGTEVRENIVRPLEPVEPVVRPLEPGDRYQGQRPADALGPVDLGADPRKLGSNRRMPGESSDRGRAKSSSLAREKEMEQELDKLNKHLTAEVGQLQDKKTESDEQFEDNFPPSKKAQVLREVLEQEYDDRLPPNINDMWTRFKEKNEQSMTESSLNSTRLDALSGLLQNPTHHDVKSFIEEKREKTEKEKKEERETVEKLREQKLKERELEKKKIAEKAAEQRSLKRQELRQRHGLSEEESNGSYSEILLENERKKSLRREEKAEKRQNRERERSPKKRQSGDGKEKKVKERTRKTKEEASETDIRARNTSSKHSDTMDTLFSIPEDASFEQSPTKAESEMKSRQKRQRHVIDPLMKKLRDKIKMQRVKIDKERRKELQRVEKLKKLEMLLNAKRKGKLSDKAIDVELHDVSSTTTASQSESSHLTESTLTGVSTGIDSDASTQESTTMKDSTLDSYIKLQVKRYPDEYQRESQSRKEYRSPAKRYVESDSAESSDFSNIIVERLPEKKSEKRNKDKNKKSGKKYKVDEHGNKIRKEKKDKKKGVFGVDFTENDITNQIKRYEKYLTPEKQRHRRVESCLNSDKRRMQDASTMYPSPVTISPPSRRRMREVLMKSEAIQTSPSIRSSSPTHAYDEVPVAPVPYMTAHGQKMSKRRPSPSPTRSNQTSFSTSPPRRTSQSPGRKTSRSPAVQRRRTSPLITRKQARSPIWKPESEMPSPPPDNSMFTPEGDENSAPSSQEKKEAQSWFIEMKPSQPWRQPLKERQAFSVRQQAWEPKSVTQSTWKNIVHGDVLKDKTDPNDVSRDTKFDLDTEGHPIGEETLSDSEDDLDISRSKPLSKMTLQEAFQARKGTAISHLRERQKRLNLAAEQRKMEVYLKMERDRLFQEERKKEANPDAHPYSDHLHKPSRRVISKEEMREITKNKYKKLPEVIEQQKRLKREQEYSLNRVKARLFNRKVQKKVLVKAEKWGR